MQKGTLGKGVNIQRETGVGRGGGFVRDTAEQWTLEKTSMRGKDGEWERGKGDGGRGEVTFSSL